jgi:hypothetical protein
VLPAARVCTCAVQIPPLKQKVRRFWQQRNEAGNLGLGPGEGEDEEQTAGELCG